MKRIVIRYFVQLCFCAVAVSKAKAVREPTRAESLHFSAVSCLSPRRCFHSQLNSEFHLQGARAGAERLTKSPADSSTSTPRRTSSPPPSANLKSDRVEFKAPLKDSSRESAKEDGDEGEQRLQNAATCSFVLLSANGCELLGARSINHNIKALLKNQICQPIALSQTRLPHFFPPKTAGSDILLAEPVL